MYFTKLKSRKGKERKRRKERKEGTVDESEVWYIWSLNIMSQSRNPPSQNESFSRSFIYSRTPVTRTRKGNQRQFELQLDGLHG